MTGHPKGKYQGANGKLRYGNASARILTKGNIKQVPINSPRRWRCSYTQNLRFIQLVPPAWALQITTWIIQRNNSKQIDSTPLCEYTLSIQERWNVSLQSHPEVFQLPCKLQMTEWMEQNKGKGRTSGGDCPWTGRTSIQRSFSCSSSTQRWTSGQNTLGLTNLDRNMPNRL